MTTKRRPAILAALVLAVLAAGCGASTASTSASTVAQSPQDTLNAVVSQMGIVGAAAAIVTPGANGAPQINYYNAGTTTSGGPTPVTSQTEFEIGSLTKVFTADLLAALVAQGKVSLSDPVQKYAPAGITVPTFTTPSGTVVPITLGNLATQQSGLTYLPPDPNQGCPGGTTCVRAQALFSQNILWQQLSQTKLLWQPGTNWLYSNFGFGILGTVLANVADPGQSPPPYENALQRNVLTNFPMPNTALETPGIQMATGYSLSGQQANAMPQWLNTNALAGAGGLVSDTTDMAVWMAAHLGYPVGHSPNADQPLVQTLQLVSTAPTVCQQTDPQDCSATPQAMGLGWQLYPANNVILQPFATKNGATSGFQSQAFLIPSAKIGVVVLANTVTPSDLAPLASQLLAQALAQH